MAIAGPLIIRAELFDPGIFLSDLGFLLGTEVILQVAEHSFNMRD